MLKAQWWTIVPAVVGAASGCLCESDQGVARDEELGELVLAQGNPQTAIDLVAAQNDFGELLRATALAPDTVHRAVGSYRLSGESHIVVVGDRGTRDEYRDTFELRMDQAGHFAASVTNSQGYGREALFVGGALFLRPGHGAYHKRAPTDHQEPVRIAADITGAVPAALELLARRATTSTKTPTSPDRAEFSLQLSASPRPVAALTTGPSPPWRDAADVLAVSGDLSFHRASGTLLRGRVHGELKFQRDGSAYTMVIDAEQRIDIIDVEPVSAPESSAVKALVARPRELSVRDSLLRGLAAPSQRQARGDP